MAATPTSAGHVRSVGGEAYNKSDDGNIDYNVYSSSVVHLFFSSGAAGGCIHIDR